MLSEEHLALRRTVRDFARRELAPYADRNDKTGEFPRDGLEKLAQYGYLGMLVPEEYGGAGMDMLSHAICVEEVSRADASLGVIMEVHNSLHCEAIVRYGTEEQKRRWLPALAQGRRLGAFALTEPDAGSDAASISTRAERTARGYVLHGTKALITGAGEADQYIVFAVTQPGKGARGISAFVVDAATPGLSFGRTEDKMGIRASRTADVFLDGCEIPAENLLGEENEGFRIALSLLDGGRIGIAAQALGIAQAALDRALAYAKERKQFGKAIAEFQGIQWMLAEMATDIEAARHMVYWAARTWDEKGRATREAAMAKLFASRVANKHTSNAVQIHGGYGYIREYEVERLMRDAKITEIYEGTSEMMRIVIAKNLVRD